MTRKKPYDDGCATAHALDLIGERWALLIVRELIPGPKRFTDLKAALPGISANVLTIRLADLEGASILTRERLPPPAPAQVYRLTAWGAELEPVIKAIGRWAARSPLMVPGKPMSAASVMLSLRTMFAPEHAEGVNAEIAVVLGDIEHRAVIRNGALLIEPGKAEAPALQIAGDPNALAAVIYGGESLAKANGRTLSITGDEALAERFVRMFPLPDKAPALV